MMFFIIPYFMCRSIMDTKGHSFVPLWWLFSYFGVLIVAIIYPFIADKRQAFEQNMETEKKNIEMEKNRIAMEHQKASTWTCPECAYENPAYSSTCEHCGYTKP